MNTTTEHVMFKHLDDIDWASMNHAYGSAADVPDLIRALASDDAMTRDDAFSEAYGNIFHQGTRYEATAPAVPFLLEILAEPDYAGAEEMLHLLAHLVMGYDDGFIPYGFGYEIAGMRAELAALESREPAARKEDSKDDLGWGTDEDWLRWIVSITDEMRNGVPRLIRLLGADDEGVRIGAAFVLSWLPEDLEMFGPALWEAASTDESDVVRANALIALSLASSDAAFAEYVEETKGLLTDGEPIVQFAAAVALGTHCSSDAPDAAVQILLDAVSHTGDDDDSDEDDADGAEQTQLAWRSGDLGSFASDVLAVACAKDPERIVNALSGALPGMNTIQASSAAGTVISLLFPDGFEDDSAADLDELQRKFLELLAEARSPWFMGDAQYANFSLMMGDFGLPSSMEKLREFLT